jgi:ribosomal subunit interface protein
MRLDIFGQGMDVSETLRTRVEQRLRYTLSRFGRRIVRVVVLLGVLNASRADTDTGCRITVSLVRLGQVIVEDTDANMCAAIDRAVDRAGRLVQLRLGRGRRW